MSNLFGFLVSCTLFDSRGERGELAMAPPGPSATDFIERAY